MMNVQRQLFLGLALGSSLLFGALPVVAQTGNQSDVTGAIVTTGDIVGGAFAPAPDGSTGGSSSFANTSVQTAVNQAAAAINTQLSQGAIAGLSPAAQQALLSLLTGTGNTAAAAASLESALVAGGANPALAQALVKSLQGLTANGQVSPTKLAAAVAAFNALVNGSSGSSLQSPSPQLQAARSTLIALVKAVGVAKS